MLILEVEQIYDSVPQTTLPVRSGIMFKGIQQSLYTSMIGHGFHHVS